MNVAPSQADSQDVSPPVSTEDRPATPSVVDPAEEAAPDGDVDDAATEAEATPVRVRRPTPGRASRAAGETGTDSRLALPGDALLALPIALVAVWAAATMPPAMAALLVALAALPVALVALPTLVVVAAAAAVDRGL